MHIPYHSSTDITSCFSMIMHSPMSQGSLHNSWKLKMSHFSYGLHTHQTCHLIEHDLDRCVRHRVPVPTNIQHLHSAIEKKWDNIPQATINSLISSMWRRCLCMKQIVLTPNTDWFSDPCSYFLLFCFDISEQHMHIGIPSHVKSLDKGLISIDLFIFLFRVHIKPRWLILCIGQWEALKPTVGRIDTPK